MSKLIACALLLGATLLPASAAPTPAYHVAHRFVLGGDGGWDYLTFDPVGNRLFISRSTRVMVVDPVKGSLIAEIPNTPGVHGIALAQDLGKGFTSNGRDNSVSVFDLKTLQTTAKVSINAKNPDAILYDAASKRVFTFNGGSNDTTVIDATTNTVAATIPLGGKPEFAVADGKGMVYDNIEDTNEIVAIDANKAAVTARWPLAPCTSPSGLAMDRQNRRLFVACDNMMAVVDADSGKVITTLPTGPGTDAARFDASTNLAFAPNGGNGTLSVIHEDGPNAFSVVQTAKSERFARTMALNPNTHDVYLVTADIQTIPGAAGARPQRMINPGSFAVLVMSP